MNKKIKLLVVVCLLLAFTSLKAGESFIPLQKGLRIASDDLIYNDQVLSSREADILSNSENVDLSALSPKSNDIWSEEAFSLNDQEIIAINDNDTMTYEGALLSNSGLYRFNAIPTNGNKIYTVHLDKTLHTMLLRKNILRKLGYKIPAMKYIKKLSIQFSSKFAMDNFLKREIPEATLGASERWVKINAVSPDQLLVELNDVAITEPSENDFYNVSMGIPTQTINSRTLRSLIIPYSLADLYESINKFSWINGKIDNKSVYLSHFTANEFNTSLDDAVWMIKKINKLSRADYEAMVKEAFFPAEVVPVIVEKLISRRNSLNRLFSLKESEIAYNNKLTIGTAVVDGKIIQKDYPGYASRFAYGDAESPLDQLRYYLYSKLQSNVIDNVVNKFNEYLVAYEINEARKTYFQKQFEDGLNHFIETGELIPIGIGTWHSPLLSANLILSRDIVLGNYLGTDNMVQLADTFGGSVEVGLFVGIEGLGNNLSSSAKVTTSLVRTFSHLKPVKNLRESLKQPYRNMIVPLLKRSLKEKYFSLYELEKTDLPTEERAKKIQETLKEIDQYLDVGESLIITDRFMPSASLRLNFNQGLIGAGVGVGGGVTVLKRIHLYKKSPKVLQVYDDRGFVKNINVSMQVSGLIPLIRVTGQFDKGHYGIKSYMVNLSSDLEENPNLYSNALGVYNVLKDRNFELLDSNNKPVELDAQFKDRSFAFSLLFWKVKAVKGKTYYDLKAKDDVHGRYFTINKDYMSGINAESFSKQMANYYLSKELESEDFSIQITDEADKNPGESFFGRSYTQSIRFEASVNDDNSHNQKFLSASDVRQGWMMGQKRLVKFMKKVNSKFQHSLFEVDQIDFKKLRLFRIGYHMNIYNRGIDRLNQITVSEIAPIEARYRKEKGCLTSDEKYYSLECGSLANVASKIRKCDKAKDAETLADCNVTLFETMFNEIEFNDLRNLLGENNFYVYGTIDGFREKSEILNDTVYSNTIGKIGSKQWDGPMDVVRDLLGLSGGEFSGSWLREGI